MNGDRPPTFSVRSLPAVVAVRGRTSFSVAVWVVLSLLALSACEEVEQVVDGYRDETPHEAYLRSLRDAGLDRTALGSEWIRASAAAIEDPVPVELPYREQGWLPPGEPTAVGYRLALRRGQVLTVDVDLEQAAGAGPGAAPPADGTRLFVDFFRLAEDPADPPRPVQSADSLGPGRFAYEPWREGEYLLRVQPELLRGGRFRVTLSLDPALAFPVDGRGMGAVQSFFGAARDAGARSHHGVDIFAPRGTPVLAAADGTVRRANETPRGGRVVWLRDGRRSQSLYYAHLDSQVVRSGDRVSVGDTVGFVGNTGNARTTPPHLHFGIYQRGRGPVDPMDYLRPIRRALPGLPEDAARLGGWVRIARDGTRLRMGPGEGAAVIADLAGHTPIRVLGGTDDWWRGTLPDGRTGYVASRLTEPVESAVAERVASSGDALRSAPGNGAPVVANLDVGAKVAVLGRFGGFDLIEAPPDSAGFPRRGWLATGRQPASGQAGSL